MKVCKTNAALIYTPQILSNLLVFLVIYILLNNLLIPLI